jgi:hypothetical protein
MKNNKCNKKHSKDPTPRFKQVFKVEPSYYQRVIVIYPGHHIYLKETWTSDSHKAYHDHPVT